MSAFFSFSFNIVPLGGEVLFKSFSLPTVTYTFPSLLYCSAQLKSDMARACE